MRRLEPLPPWLHGRAFLTTDVPPGTFPIDRLRAPDVQRPSRGVRAIGLDPDAVRDRCLAFQPRMPRGQAFSHLTAAQLYGIPLPPWLEARATLHVAVNEVRQPPRVRGVVGHSLEGVEARFWWWSGFVVTDPVSTWCQLASVLSHYDLVAAGDYLVSGRPLDDGSREPALTTIDALRAGIARYAGRRGVRNMRAAIERVRAGVDSRPETWLRLLLVDDGLPEPVVNQPVFDEAGNRLGKPDLAYHWARTVFDYEGEGHLVSKQRFKADIVRREVFESALWRYVRVQSGDVFDDQRSFLLRVRRIIAQQASARTHSLGL
ncbi:hypothetical protein [Glaciibacter sp. 2TAF33]|uniref:hypothetical protein n=1 Tax=Glaciibacter sp. 2TAF33 TaxID=3233015 RepID=UPI003F90C144